MRSVPRWIVAAVAAVAVGCAGTSRAPATQPQTPTVSAAASAPVRAPSPGAIAELRGLTGEPVGQVSFTQTPAGVLVAGTVSGLGLGAHGIHIHAVGSCVPPFTSAGPHFNPENRHHGFLNPDGHHVGDMPNLILPAAGRYSFQQLIAGAHLTGDDGMLDADGASIVIHGSRDDYATDPSGDSGGRIACGVIVAQ